MLYILLSLFVVSLTLILFFSQVKAEKLDEEAKAREEKNANNKVLP